MFSNRRKRIEQNKIVYYQNQLSTVLSPKNGIIPELQEETLWESNGNNIYNTNTENVGIGIRNPLWQMDISGSLNVTNKIMINGVSIAPPIGSIMAYVSASTPDGWLVCDGSPISRTTYANLFIAIGTTFGAGNNTTTFNLPDYRGAFLRGTGRNGTNTTYAGPNIGASQNHATEVHNHTATSSVTDTGHSHTQYTINDDFNNSGGAPSGSIPSFPPSDSAGSRNWTNINNSTTGVTVATTVANSTRNTDANETRPFNYGVYWIIKY